MTQDDGSTNNHEIDKGTTANIENDNSWELVVKLFENKETYKGKIESYNNGGLIVFVHGHKGFIPASQVSIARHNLNPNNVPKNWANMVGESIRVRIVELDEPIHRFILSELAVTKESRSALKARVVETLVEGQEYNGQVTSLMDYGAFVNVMGGDGLLHVSDFIGDKGKHPRDVLTVGQIIRVKVINIDREKKRFGLSLVELGA